MARTAYTRKPWSARYLQQFMAIARPPEHPRVARQAAIWDELSTRAESNLDAERLELDELEGASYYDREQLLLFAVGSLCLQAGQGELWRTIYRTVNEWVEPDEEIDFLEQSAAAVRVGEL